jgi:tetratricopeptide (TPR) repeat protein
MRPAVKDPADTIQLVASVARLDDLAKEEGQRHGPLILQRPPSAWRGMMNSDPHYRSFGTLKFLLEAARSRFETEPTVAHEITSAVLDFVTTVEGPSRVHEIGLRGLAWKEHANALQVLNDLPRALVAAERAISIYAEVPSLLFDQTRARLVLCKIYRDLDNTEEALRIARDCAAIFLDFEHWEFRTAALMCEGGVLFKQKRFAEALRIFTDLIEQAEVQGDKLTLARGLNNAAECARELGDLAAARDLYPRALAHFEELKLPPERNRVRWGYALSLAAEGNVRRAVWELLKVRAAYLRLGMNATAACAALDVVRLRFDADEDVADLCTDLVTTFTAAGLTQNAIEALAYLREQAKSGSITTKKITRVRTYFGELLHTPTLLFARPLDEEG